MFDVIIASGHRLSQTVRSHCWRGAVPEDMYAHAELNKGVVEVVVFVPKESQIVPVIFIHEELIEHLFYVCCDCVGVAAKPQEDSKQAVCQIWSCQHHLVQRKTLEGGRGVKNSTNLTRFLWVINAEKGQVPATALLFLRRRSFCRPRPKNLVHEFEHEFSLDWVFFH